MKKILFFVSILVVGTLVYFAVHHLRVRAYANEAVNTRPFVMERVDFKVQNDKEVPVVKAVIAQRRDGGTVRISSSDGQVMRRIDLPGGYIAMIVDALHIKSSGTVPNKMAAARVRQLKQASTTCIAGKGEIVDGEDQLFGQRAIRIVQEKPDGLQRRIHWLMPDFACAVVQTFLQKRSDLTSPWQTTNGTRLTAFVEQDPDPRMFSDTSAYREMKPSDLKREVMKNNGVTSEKCPKCFSDDAEADTNYQKWQAPSYAP